MTTLKEIKGQTIQALDTDPSNLGAGQVWYNTTTNKLKITAVSTSGAWASGGNMGTGRRSTGSVGTQTAGLAFGGAVGGSTATEEYAGPGFTTQTVTSS